MRFVVFRVVVLSILFPIWFWVWWILVRPLCSWVGSDCLSPLASQVVTAFFVLSFAAQFWRWVFFRQADRLPWVLTFAYWTLGVMTHLLLLSFLIVILESVLPTPWITGRYQFFVLTGIITALLANLWGVWTALQGPEILTQVVKSEKWKNNKPIRLLQISDLHLGPVIKRKYVEKFLEQIRPLEPHLIFLTGDIGDGQVEQLRNDAEALRPLAQLAPVFYVPGNHEFYWDEKAWIGLMKEFGFVDLISRGVKVSVADHGELWVGGVPDIDVGRRFNPDRKHYDMIESLKGSDAKQFRLLLAHQPKSCFEAETAGYDLMLSGHTHAGQFFPFNFLVKYFNPYVKGLNQHGSLQVYVNKGTGFWGPPLRLGTRSEITLLEIRGS